ncbi:uncharacterized protein DEA37_0000938 [Paragonimus westermani]|uniref:Uncharacterized protein n=1 Tax=Paragonimus westermani TaxID=34504 RepID=A0A5J4NUZ1_9TREM|nr:uncharacterized protein DEA37_0000938 [Paragonimus westermani]
MSWVNCTQGPKIIHCLHHSVGLLLMTKQFTRSSMSCSIKVYLLYMFIVMVPGNIAYTVQYMNIPSVSVGGLPGTGLSALTNEATNNMDATQLPLSNPTQSNSLLSPTFTAIPRASLPSVVVPDINTRSLTGVDINTNSIGEPFLNPLVTRANLGSDGLSTSLSLTQPANTQAVSGLETSLFGLLNNQNTRTIQPTVDTLNPNPIQYMGAESFAREYSTGSNIQSMSFSPKAKSTFHYKGAYTPRSLLPTVISPTNVPTTARSVTVTTPSITLNTVRTSVLPPIVRSGTVTFQPVQPRTIVYAVPGFISYMPKSYFHRKHKRHVRKEYNRRRATHRYEKGVKMIPVGGPFDFDHQTHFDPFFGRAREFGFHSHLNDFHKFRKKHAHKYRKRFMDDFSEYGF